MQTMQDYPVQVQCLRFCFASKTEKQKTPHTCLYQPHGGYYSPSFTTWRPEEPDKEDVVPVWVCVCCVCGMEGHTGTYVERRPDPPCGL
jgi:hypothetical protein